MCGRYTLVTRREDLAKDLGIPVESIPAELKPRYNIAPSQLVPILLQDGGIRFALFQWGLIPHWAKDPSIGNRMINARMETLAEKPSFRGSLKRKRCLVLADGFYEWHETVKGKPKVPYYIRLKSRKPFTFAGLWSSWTDPSGEEVLTCTIITGSSNELISAIHHRMPIILPEHVRTMWLDPGVEDVEALLSILRPLASEEIEMFPVTRHVNSPSNDDPGCVEPADGGAV
jgi:putative SOS response-associated peptidase YedK